MGLRAEVRPALTMQGFFEETAEAARAGLYTRRGILTSWKVALRMAKVVERYGDVTVVRWPSRAFQRLVLAAAPLPASGLT